MSQRDVIPTLRSELMATSAHVRSLEQEVAALQDRLRLATEKADGLRALLAIYEAESGARPEQREAEARPSVAPAQDVEPSGELRRLTKKARMELEITDLLKLRGKVHRSVILSHLQAKGLVETDKNPLAHLAAYLSNNRDKFASDGRGNFTLAHPEPPPAPSSAGSAEGRNPGSHPGLPFNHQHH